MTERRFTCEKKEVRFQRATSPLFFRRKGSRRRGQTLTEYVLLLAYMSIFTIQALQSLGFSTKKEYAITSCSLLISELSTQSQNNQMSAVDTLLGDPTTWGDSDPNQVAAAVLQIHNTMHVIIYGY